MGLVRKCRPPLFKTLTLNHNLKPGTGTEWAWYSVGLGQNGPTPIILSLILNPKPGTATELACYPIGLGYNGPIPII